MWSVTCVNCRIVEFYIIKTFQLLNNILSCFVISPSYFLLSDSNGSLPYPEIMKKCHLIRYSLLPCLPFRHANCVTTFSFIYFFFLGSLSLSLLFVFVLRYSKWTKNWNGRWERVSGLFCVFAGRDVSHARTGFPHASSAPTCFSSRFDLNPGNRWKSKVYILI